MSFKKGENRQPAFLAINPMGKLPALGHGDVVVTEAAGHLHYLADEFQKAKLNVPIGRPPARHLSEVAVLRPELRRARHHRARLPAGPAAAIHVGLRRRRHRGRRAGQGRRRRQSLPDGRQFTAADVIIGSGLRWGMMFKLLRAPGVQDLRRPPRGAPGPQRATEKDAKLQKEQEAS